MIKEQLKNNGDNIDIEPTIPSEIRQLMKWARFTGISRFDGDDKEPSEALESTGAHISHMMMLTHYFWRVMPKESIEDISYRKVFDTIIASDIADVSQEYNQIIGIHKTDTDIRREIISTAKVITELPNRNKFASDISDAYEEYLRQNTKESRFVRAINGLSAMFFILSRCEYSEDLDALGNPQPQVGKNIHDLRRQLVGENGYTLADYDERIGQFCKEFPPIDRYYTIIRRVFSRYKYFAEEVEVVDPHTIDTPDTRADIFATHLGKPLRQMQNITTENNKLLRLWRLKKSLRWGKENKKSGVLDDTDGEHLAGLLLLARYFQQAVDKESRDAEIVLFKLAEYILVHELPEAKTGDTVSDQKTNEHDLAEHEAMDEIVNLHLPRSGDTHTHVEALFNKYEVEKKSETLVASTETFMKAIDSFEAMMTVISSTHDINMARDFVFNPSNHKMQSLAKFIRLFPVLKRHADNFYKRIYPDSDLFSTTQLDIVDINKETK